MCLQGNSFTANCGNSSYAYLDICDKLLNSTDVAAASVPTSSPAVDSPTMAAPVAAVAPAVTPPPADASGVATQRSGHKSPGVMHHAAAANVLHAVEDYAHDITLVSTTGRHMLQCY